MEFLNKIKKENIPDQVFGILKEGIVSGRYQVGDRLPSENELAEKLGVSRSSVKIALQKLHVLGMIETRVGDGSYVKAFDVSAYLYHVSDLLLGPDDLDDIAEYRKYFEIDCARLAMQNATEADFAAVEQIVDRMDEAVAKGDFDEYARLDYLFHYEICKSTKNRIFALSYETIGELIFQFTVIKNRKYFDMFLAERTVDTHRLILRAIVDRDIEACIEHYTMMFDI